MSVSLRLSRGGSKKRPFFRIVAADIRSPRDGKYLERLGTYNPMKTKDDPERINLNIERIKYWLSVGAKPTDRVTKFLAKEGLAKKPVIQKQTKQDKPKKKTLEKIKAKEEKLKSKKDLGNAAQNAPLDATNTQQNQPIEKPVDQPSDTTKPDALVDAKQEQDKPAEAVASKAPPSTVSTEPKPEEAKQEQDKPAEAATSKAPPSTVPNEPKPEEAKQKLNKPTQSPTEVIKNDSSQQSKNEVISPNSDEQPKPENPQESEKIDNPKE